MKQLEDKQRRLIDRTKWYDERKIFNKACLAERSKAADSRSAGETRVSSNLTARRFLFNPFILIFFSKFVKHRRVTWSCSHIVWYKVAFFKSCRCFSKECFKVLCCYSFCLRSFLLSSINFLLTQVLWGISNHRNLKIWRRKFWKIFVSSIKRIWSSNLLRLCEISLLLFQ